MFICILNVCYLSRFASGKSTVYYYNSLCISNDANNDEDAKPTKADKIILTSIKQNKQNEKEKKKKNIGTDNTN